MVSGYVKGLLEISVEGMNLERFLNLWRGKRNPTAKYQQAKVWTNDLRH